MAFAALARGASQQEVGDMLAAAIRSSVEKGEYHGWRVVMLIMYLPA